MVANGIEYQKRHKENGNTDCDKPQTKKHPSAVEEKHTFKN